MIPVFKSTYSIGKSILTLEPKGSVDGPDSILDLCKEHQINPLILVEDSMTGFVKAHTLCKEGGIQLIFGLRITCCNCIEEEDDSDHKIIIFAKNDKGCKLLNKIYSHAHTVGSKKIDFPYLNKIWSDDIELVIPFYDSFIFNNHMHLKNCVPDFTIINPTLWIEQNNLPFDQLIKEAVDEFAKKMGYDTQNIKTILYKNKEDVYALQTYKILCNRNFGRAASLSSPNLNHFGSDEFCLESYLENERVSA